VLLPDVVTQGEDEGIDGARTRSSDTDNVLQDSPLFEDLHRSHVSDTLHASSFENQVAELCGHVSSVLAYLLYLVTRLEIEELTEERIAENPLRIEFLPDQAELLV
jgi:hypothetical protein